MRFSCQGDIGNGSVTLRQHNNVEKPDNDVSIQLTEPVSLTFSLKYLVNFCKASGLAGRVKLCLSQEVPLLVEYSLSGTSYLRFYLAPKVCSTHSKWNQFADHFRRLAMMSRHRPSADTFELRKWSRPSPKESHEVMRQRGRRYSGSRG